MTQSPAWRDAALADRRHRDASIICVLPSGRRVLVPLLEPRVLPHRTSAASWSRRWGTGGPLVEGGMVERDDAAAVLREVASRGRLASSVRLRFDSDPSWLQAAAGQFETDSSTTWILDLSEGFDHVWKRSKDNAQRGARKAVRCGVEVECDRSDRGVDVFWELYRRSLRRWSSERHEPLLLTRARLAARNPTSRSQLTHVARCFGPDCATWIASVNGRVVAASIVLTAGSAAKGWRRAMDKELAAPVFANSLLDKLAIEQLCREGRRSLDLGAADIGSSLASAKAKLGAEPHPAPYLLAAPGPVRAVRSAARAVLEATTGES